MCNETGIPEFPGFQIPGIPMVQILKNPPEYTKRNSVQPGRNTKNEAHAHLLGTA